MPATESDKPYQLKIALDIAPHRILTDVFKQQLVRELNDLLQQELGGLAQVEVRTDHPLLKELPGRDILSVLANLQDAGPIKTHLLRIDFVDGQFYQIEAAQHDGLTGLISPVVKQVRTADRPLVGKLAAELVWRDFGTVGTVLDAKDPSRVRLGLKAGKLPGGQRLVQRDDVFAIAQVNRGGGRIVREAFLQVIDEPQDGIVHCQLLARYADDASKLKDLPGVLGYRCRKLCTTVAPLKLRLVDDQGQPHEGLRIEVGRPGSKAAPESKGLTDRNGMLDTRSDGSRLVLVGVLHQGVARARVPVPILDDRLAVIRVTIDAQVVDHHEFRMRKRGLNDLINGLLLTVNQVSHDINDLIRDNKHVDALARARQGVKLIEKSRPALRDELRKLAADALRAKLAEAEQLRLRDDSGLKQLDTALANLEAFVQAQDLLLQEKAKQQELQAEILNLVNQARLARDQADYDEAISLLEQALAKAGKKPNLEKELASLKAGWRKIAGPEHEQARHFIYGVWAKAESVEQLREQLAEVRKQLAVCQKLHDILALNKFLVVYPAHAKRLEQFLVNQRRDTEQGFKLFETYDAVAEELLKLHQEVSEFVLAQMKK